MKDYTNNLIISQHNISPPFNWAKGVFQRYSPISGNFKIGPGIEGNNPTGRGYNANGIGYWNQSSNQFNGGKHYSTELQGSLFPVKEGMTTPPQDRITFGYSRIGENWRN